MSPLEHLGALLAIVVAAGVLVRVPRRLFTGAADEVPARSLEWRLGAALTLAGGAAYGAAAYSEASGYGVFGPLAYGLAIMVFVAIVYSDLTFLLIPDLYSAALALLAVSSVWRLPLVDALAGAVICGGLLATLAFVWRRMTSADGLGFGDVKLAAAVGGLLGAIEGLLAVSISAGLAALLVYGLRLLKRRKDAVPLVPYGAALALVGGAGLTVRVL